MSWILSELAALTPHLVTFLSVLTLAGQLIVLILLVLLLVQRDGPVVRWVGERSVVLMFIVACTAMFGSLYFSEIAGWTPCKLCWFQRIFLYPQVFLLGVALWKRDRNVAWYILVLSIIGAAFAAFHYGEQVSAALWPAPESLLPCDDTGVSCAHTPFFHFGYITIPLMAFTAFVLNAVGSLLLLRRSA